MSKKRQRHRKPTNTLASFNSNFANEMLLQRKFFFCFSKFTAKLLHTLREKILEQTEFDFRELIGFRTKVLLLFLDEQ